MTKRIAGVVASNLGFHNTGMTSVDLALHSVCKSLPEPVEVSWYSVATPSVVPIRGCVDEASLPFRIQPIVERLDEVLAHDRIVYWGDFQHARHWQQQGGLIASRRMGYADDVAGAEAILRRSLLLADAPDDVFSKVVLYGGTLINVTQQDFLDVPYREALTRLVSLSRSARFRDVFSAMKVAHLRGTFDLTSHLGADCALLVDQQTLDALPRTAWSAPRNRPTMAISVGARSELDLSTLVRRGVELAERLGLQPEWLPWLPNPKLDKVREVLPREVVLDESPYTVGDLFAMVGQHKMIFTDTYHLAINAWRAGVPAVCIGSLNATEQLEARTLNDNKKFTFYMMYSAFDFYVDTAELASDAAWQARLEQLAQPDLATTMVQPIVARMRDHARVSLDALVGALGA